MDFRARRRRRFFFETFFKTEKKTLATYQTEEANVAFGRKAHLKEEIELLEILSDIEVVTKIIKQEVSENIHPLDEKYNNLNCNLKEATKAEKSKIELLLKQHVGGV